jgi:hypothetical protein
MKEEVKEEIQELIVNLNLNCLIEEVKDLGLGDWISISGYQELSEDLIREYKDEIVWDGVTFFQNLSEDFIYEFKDKLDIEVLIYRKLITKQRLKEMELKELEWKKKISKRGYKFELMDI